MALKELSRDKKIDWAAYAGGADNAQVQDMITEDEMIKRRNRDRELVTGQFKNLEQPGGFLEFSFLKWPGDRLKHYKGATRFEDGKVYTIPRAVAMHIANGCSYPQHGFREDDRGNIIAEVAKTVHRFAFVPTEFMDEKSLAELKPRNTEQVTFLQK